MKRILHPNFHLYDTRNNPITSDPTFSIFSRIYIVSSSPNNLFPPSPSRPSALKNYYNRDFPYFRFDVAEISRCSTRSPPFLFPLKKLYITKILDIDLDNIAEISRCVFDNTRLLPKRIRGSRSQGLNDHQVAGRVPENFVVAWKPVHLANVNVAEVSATEVFNDVQLLPGEV